jgi:glutamine synthetase
MKLVPDKSTYKKCPWNPKQGIVFVDLYDLDDTPFRMCPRNIL